MSIDFAGLEARVPGPRTSSSLLLPALLAAVTSLLHIATSNDSWGIFRDELYYVACSKHLAFGYVDHPPLVALLTWVARHLFGESLIALRLLPALAAGGSVFLTILIVRKMGGAIFAQVLAGLLVALTPVYISAFGYLSMNAFDILLWTAAVACIVALIESADPRWWIAFGLVAGLGLQNKISMLFLGFGLVVGLLLMSGLKPFRTRWFWLAGAIAALLFLPHVLWQMRNDWPTLEFMRNATQNKNLPISPVEFLLEQVSLMGPVIAAIAVVGFVYCFVSREGRRWMPLGWAVAAVAVVLILQRGKPYYLSPAYTMLFATGALAIERMSARKGLGWLRAAIIALVVVSGIVFAPLAKPLLPVETHVRYTQMLGVAPGTDERKEVGRLSQFFADRLGWRELAALVAQVHASLPASDRDVACVYGQNYGQAGAIDYFRSEMDVPPVLSGHNNYFFWGPGTCSGQVVIIIGGERADHERSFESVEEAALYRCADCMPYEDNKTIFVGRRLRAPLAEVWPRSKHFD